jgi:hypothetical protein
MGYKRDGQRKGQAWAELDIFFQGIGKVPILAFVTLKITCKEYVT